MPIAAASCAATASCSRGSASSLPSAHRSRFAAIHSGHPGVDPYTTAVSDVYQDLYGEGSFTGKGIYDVDAFERATHGRFPENTLLSHDLIEGNYARAGLATDIVVYDDYPARYLTFTRRKHRWIRGDWQLLRWLTNRVPGPDGPEPNRLSLLSRWKILDNLRRSTVELAQLAFLVAGWTVLPGDRRCAGRCWASARSPRPRGRALLLAMLRPPLDKSWRAYYAAVGHDAATSLQQVALAIAFLPHQAWVSADAIVRTLWRLCVTPPAAARVADRVADRAPGRGRPRGAVWRTMWPAVALPLVLLAAAMWAARGQESAGTWISRRSSARRSRCSILWSVSPSIAYALSAPAVRRERRLPASQPHGRDALRAAALALLRPVRHRGDQLARPGQLPGGSGAGRGDAHLADQHRPAAARHGQRATTSASSPRRT